MRDTLASIVLTAVAVMQTAGPAAAAARPLEREPPRPGPGEVVTVRAPAGDREYEIVDVEYV